MSGPVLPYVSQPLNPVALQREQKEKDNRASRQEQAEYYNKRITTTGVSTAKVVAEYKTFKSTDNYKFSKLNVQGLSTSTMNMCERVINFTSTLLAKAEFTEIKESTFQQMCQGKGTGYISGYHMKTIRATIAYDFYRSCLEMVKTSNKVKTNKELLTAAYAILEKRFGVRDEYTYFLPSFLCDIVATRLSEKITDNDEASKTLRLMVFDAIGKNFYRRSMTSSHAYINFLASGKFIYFDPKLLPTGRTLVEFDSKVEQMMKEISGGNKEFSKLYSEIRQIEEKALKDEAKLIVNMKINVSDFDYDGLMMPKDNSIPETKPKTPSMDSGSIPIVKEQPNNRRRDVSPVKINVRSVYLTAMLEGIQGLDTEREKDLGADFLRTMTDKIYENEVFLSTMQTQLGLSPDDALFPFNKLKGDNLRAANSFLGAAEDILVDIPDSQIMDLDFIAGQLLKPEAKLDESFVV